MPSTPSPLLRLELQATGENLSVWGLKLNALFTQTEQAIADVLTLTITGDRTLTASNFSENEYRRGTHVLVAGGGLAAPFTITLPTVAYAYRIDNRTAFAATLKTASGVGAVVRPGMVSAVFCNGTDCKVADPTLDQVKTAAGPVNFGGFEAQNAGVATSDTGLPNRGQVLALTAGNVQLASDWAQKTSGSVDGGTGYSARLWATSTAVVTGGLKGAQGYATDAAGSATNSSNSATLSQQWATVTGALVAATDYSSKEYAIGATVPAGSAKTWATSTTVVSGGFKGAYGYAQDAAASAAAALAAQAVVGPASATADAITLFNGTGGKTVKDSGFLFGSAANLFANTAGRVSTNPTLWTAQAFVTLTDAATIAVDMSTFLNAKVTLAGSRTLGAPTNAKEGQSGILQVIQDGTGSRTLSYASAWDFGQAGTPTLSTAAGKIDTISYIVINAATPVVRAYFSKAA